jgi:hypothetical protein
VVQGARPATPGAAAQNNTPQTSAPQYNAPQSNAAPSRASRASTAPVFQQPRAPRNYTASRRPTEGVLTGYHAPMEGEQGTIVEGTPMPAHPGAQLQPMPAGEIMYEGSPMQSGGCSSCGIDGGCDDGCDPCNACCYDDGGCGLLCMPWWRRMSLFGGVQGFKGPADFGVNGNFGFYEGLNFAGALGCCDIGYQFGAAAAQSNFWGFTERGAVNNDNAVFATADGGRDQAFFTGGFFKRVACAGVQWGVVFDLQHDNFYDHADLKQIRSETSFVFPNGCEIGYFGAYNIGGDVIQQRIQLAENREFVRSVGLQPTDMFVGFIRKRAAMGGEGRVWAGATGYGDGIVGAEVRVPLGGSFALENRANFLIPNRNDSQTNRREESWGLLIMLVWYPGRDASCAMQSRWQPLFGVADNSTFMVQSSRPH